MIRFKVIRGSRILLVCAVLLLIASAILLGIKWMARHEETPISTSANFVEAIIDDEAGTDAVSASSCGTVDSPGGHSVPFPEIEVVRGDEPEQASPRVLIYHTHTHEAYEQVANDPYEALEAWRTADVDHSVVRVGEELAACLSRYGLEVVHDTTDHEADQLSTSYSRSLETLQGYRERFDLYIDLHRDAYIEGEPIAHVSSDGLEMAPLMLLIGNGNGFDVKPWYAQNHAFAKVLEDRINDEEPGLCKPVLVKDGRYNQHIGVFSVLVEVGHNRNTLRQALNSIPPLADAIYGILVEAPSGELMKMQRDWRDTVSHVDHNE